MDIQAESNLQYIKSNTKRKGNVTRKEVTLH